MDAHDNAEVMLTIFRAIERRDGEGFKALTSRCIGRPRSPTAGAFRLVRPGRSRARIGRRPGARYSRPTPSGRWIPVSWRLTDGQVLGLYQLRDGKLARAQMFYFDPAGAARFLAEARLG
jgi:hypothetical protein